MKIQNLTFRNALESPAYKVHGMEVSSLVTVKVSPELKSSSPARTRTFAILRSRSDFVIEEISQNFKTTRVQPRELYDAVFLDSRTARTALLNYLNKKYE